MTTLEWLNLELSFTFYIFHPTVYSNETLQQIYDQLGFKDHSVDLLVSNKLYGIKTSLAYK
jgi:hypothetical protein